MIDDLGLSGHDSELFSFLDPSTIDGLRNHTAANIPLWTFGNVDNGKLTGVTCWNTRPSCIAFTKRPQVVTQLDGKWIRWGTFTTNDQLIEVSALTLIRHLFVQGYTCGLNGQRWISTPADPRLERLQYIRRRSDAVVDQRHWQLLEDNYALWARCKLDLALIIHLPRHQGAAT